MGEPKDSYKIMGLAPGASPEEVKDAYIELAKVWHPNLFLDDELLRQIAEEKMVAIDAAYDALKVFFRSNGYGSSMPEGKNASKDGAPENMVCDRAGCAGTIGANGRCELCGKALVSGELPYGVYCPSCGTWNYLRARKDYNRGICFRCGVPFLAPAKFIRTTSRKTAYLIFLAVLGACVWYFFFSSEDETSLLKKHPVSLSPPQQVSSNDAPETKEPGGPPAPIMSEQKAETVSPVASAPPQAIPPDAPAPAVAGNGEGPKENTFQAGNVSPDSAREKSNERYEELIDHVLRQKSMDSQKPARDLPEIPLKN